MNRAMSHWIPEIFEMCLRNESKLQIEIPGFFAGLGLSIGQEQMFNGLVLLGKSLPETMVFTIKLIGLSGFNFPIIQFYEVWEKVGKVWWRYQEQHICNNFMEKCNNVWENAEDEKRIAGTLKQISLATGWNYT